MGKSKDKPTDALGREIMEGDTVAQAYLRGTTARLRFHKVSKVEGNKMWLETTPVHPVAVPSRFVIVKYAGEGED